MAKSIVFLFAAVALFMGVFFLWIGWSSRRAGAEASRLRALTAADLESLPAGSAGYVEGVLSPDNPALVRNFVFFLRSERVGFRTDDGQRRPIWRSRDAERPDLWLDLPGRGPEADPSGLDRVRIFGPYAVTFRGSDTTWIDDPSAAPDDEDVDAAGPRQPVGYRPAGSVAPVASEGGGHQESADEEGRVVKYEGLEAGQTVVALGHVAVRPSNADRGSDPVRGLAADRLASGTFRDYLEGERGSATFGLVAGTALFLVAVVLTVVAVNL